MPPSVTYVDPFFRYSVTTLYHFTDKRNLQAIRGAGGLYSLQKLNENGISVPFPGGNKLSQEEDVKKGLHRFVHLCFKSNHPMEHVAREKKHIGETVFLQVKHDVLELPGVMYSPGVANKSGMPVHTLEEAKKNQLIDFEILFTYQDWRHPAVQDRRLQAEKCEILVPDYIPLGFIRNFPNG